MVIAFPHRPQKDGGPGSFQERIEKVLQLKGWEIIYHDDKKKPDVVLIVGGTRKLGWLIKQKVRGIPIIYRLDGINWLHRKINVSKKQWVLNEVRNILFQIIRSFFATHIIYQSLFVQKWWEKEGWKTKAEYSIIYNGIDVRQFKPGKSREMPAFSILAVEGNIDYSPYAVDLLNQLQDKFIDHSPFQSIILYGGFQSEESQKTLNKKIDYRGKISRAELPDIYKNSVYVSLDVNPACPNTVIEALASGIPVIGYDTGALKELVSQTAGEIVPYGSDPWELGFPDIETLYGAALKVTENWEVYAEGARKLAVNKYNIEDMTARYVYTIESLVKR